MTIRKNQHQTHMESLVLLGPQGLEELKDKFSGIIDEIKDASKKRLNVTTKFDGAPAVIMWSSYPGYRDNCVVLKSFINGKGDNSMNSKEEIYAKYGDRPDMAEKLLYCLELSKSIPSGEAWQGDCMFSALKEQEINGVKYLTFHPNKIVYAVSEDNPSYEKIKNSKFGICMHTIYRGENKSQSFNVDTTRLQNVPNDIFVFAPTMNVSEGTFDTGDLEAKYAEFTKAANDLLSTDGYEALCDNAEFQKYWSTFENAFTSDRESTTINVESFYDDLTDYIHTKMQKEYDKKYSTLKTDDGKAKALGKYKSDVIQMDDILTTNKELLIKLVKCFNAASNLKMSIWNGLKSIKQPYNTFYMKTDMSFIPADAEGVSVSDSDGNIVKIVDRSTFSKVNRSTDYLSGFQHESLVEGNKVARLFNHMNDDVNFALIGSLDKDDYNVSHFTELYDKVVKLSDKYTISWKRAIGTYTMDNTGETIIEKTLLINNIPEDEAVKLGKEINQESIIYKDDNFFGFIYMDGHKENCFNRDRLIMNSNELSDFSTRLASKHSFGQPFKFDFKECINPKGSGWKHNSKEVKLLDVLYEHINESTNKTAVMAMGRMNPITIGHAKLVDKVKEIAKEVGGDAKIFLTHTFDNKKNPLPYESKIKYAKKAFGDVVVESDAKTMISALAELQNKGYTDIVYVGGEDRIGGDEDVTGQLLKYNGRADKSGNIPYTFNSIKFANAGARSGDDEVSNASATKARAFVAADDFDGFKNIVPFDEEDARAMFDEIKANLKECLIEGQVHRLYHGSPNCRITKFACDDDTPRSFFTKSRPYAAEYTYDLDTGDRVGCVYDVDVTFDNPIDIDSPEANAFKELNGIKNNVMATDELYAYLKLHNGELNGQKYDCIISREDMPAAMYKKFGDESNICYIPLDSDQIQIVNKTVCESLYGAKDFEKYRKGREKHYPKLAIEMFFTDGIKDKTGELHKYNPASNIDSLPISNDLKYAESTAERIKIAIDYFMTLNYLDFIKAYNNLTGIKWTETTKTPARNMSKSTNAESETAADYSSVTESESVKRYFEDKYHKVIENITVTNNEVVGGRNSKRGVSIIDLFEKPNMYDSDSSGASTSEAISDVIFDIHITFVDNSEADDKVYVSVKLGDGTSLVNLGMHGVTAEQLADAILSNYTDNELNLIRSIVSLHGDDRTKVVAVKGDERVENFFYKFGSPNIGNIHNAIVNAYGNNYFYYRRDLNEMVFIGDVIDELKSASITDAEVSATYSSLHIAAMCHGTLYHMYLRRRGATNLQFEIRTFHGKSSLPSFRGTEVDSSYEFIKE